MWRPPAANEPIVLFPRYLSFSIGAVLSYYIPLYELIWQLWEYREKSLKYITFNLKKRVLFITTTHIYDIEHFETKFWKWINKETTYITSNPYENSMNAFSIKIIRIRVDLCIIEQIRIIRIRVDLCIIDLIQLKKNQNFKSICKKKTW